jgi:hypothetical protein
MLEQVGFRQFDAMAGSKQGHATMGESVVSCGM